MYNFNNLKNSVEKLSAEKISANLPYICRGLEKESLRQTPNGQISQTPHPFKLGSALTNSYITTDYSEALLEYITPVFKDPKELLNFLENLHTFSLLNMPEDEKIWCHSMPCLLTRETDIPIANYGSSNIGQMKHIYRHGLAWRYSRRMQTIAGVHYNFSLPEKFWSFLKENEGSELPLNEYISQGYFRLIRNFKKHVWLLFYFTGASPALCKSFLSGQKHSLESLDGCTAYKPYATSLRMSDLGYTNKEQQTLKIRFNTLEEYTSDLSKAIKTPSEEFAKIGVQVDGVYRQLNNNILQIENEFYSIIRPKRTTKSGEKPSTALRQRGVEYIEVRMLDLNPFSPIGVTLDEIHFLDIFLLACALLPSPFMDDAEVTLAKGNTQLAISEGRNPSLELNTPAGKRKFREMAVEAFSSLRHSADILNSAFNTTAYSDTLNRFEAIIDKPEQTPSGQVLQKLKDENTSFYPFARQLSAQHNAYLKNRSMPNELKTMLEEEAAKSHEKQKQLELNDSISFEKYLENYFSQ